MSAAVSNHVDDHGLWIDPNDPERWFLASDGANTYPGVGAYYSTDLGTTWTKAKGKKQGRKKR